MQMTGRRSISIPQNLGAMLLSIWLIAVGLVPLLELSHPIVTGAVHVLAIVAGIVLLWERR